MKKHQIVIPNGRITIKQTEKTNDGPMGMFVADDDEKLLKFAKELSAEATSGCIEFYRKKNSDRDSETNKRKR